VLLEAAKKVGLDADAAAAYLNNPSAGADEVNAELDKGWRRRISGVPNFTLNSQ
jgi:predicted DsbA family dithiol-disulfide isomerase